MLISIYLLKFRYSSEGLQLCGCKGRRFKFPLYLLINACTVKGTLNFTYLCSGWEEISWESVQGLAGCQPCSILMTCWCQEMSTQIGFSTSSPGLNSHSCTARSPRMRAIPAEAFRASLFLHLLSRDGINKSMDPALTGLWCPLASYFSSCQSTRTLICWNTLMHCVTPWRMFIKLFFNEEQGSISDHGDSCIPTPMDVCWSLRRISTPEDKDNMESFGSSWNINDYEGKS